MEKRGRGSPVKGNIVSTGELPRRQIIPSNPRKYGTLAVSGSIGDFQLITPTRGINTVGIPPTRTCPLLFDIERLPFRSQFVFRTIDHFHKKIHRNEEMRADWIIGRHQFAITLFDQCEYPSWGMCRVP